MCVVVLHMKVHESSKTEGTTFNNREKVNDDRVPSHARGYIHPTAHIPTLILHTHTHTHVCSFLEEGMLNSIVMRTCITCTGKFNV